MSTHIGTTSVLVDFGEVFLHEASPIRGSKTDGEPFQETYRAEIEIALFTNKLLIDA